MSFFTWSGWSFFVALGTLTLAGVTAWLARESRRQIDLSAREVSAVERQTEAVHDQAEATKRQVALSTASLEASSRPVLVGVVAPHRMGHQPEDWNKETVLYSRDHVVQVRSDEVDFAETDEMVYCSVPLRNIGAGVAFLQEATLVTPTGYFGRVSNPIVAPGETTRARFSVVRHQSDGRATDVNETTRTGRGFAQFKIRLVYTGASRDLLTVSEITVAEVPPREFIYVEQTIWDGDGKDRKLLVSTENIG